jgi:hypothetical protein
MAVYFIRAGEDGPVKIGTTDSPVDRLKLLQAGNHLPLRIIRTMEGSRRVEAALHRKFAEHHIRAEWFNFHADMLTVSVAELDVRPRGRPRTCQKVSSVAARVIEKCGGHKAVARALSVDPSWVYRLTYPKSRGGTGGIIPVWRYHQLMAAFPQLTPNDFFEPQEIAQ